MRRWRISLAFAALAAFACNALTGAGDLGIGEPCDACDAASRPDDAAPDAPGETGPMDASVPAYCRGIVLYARLDGTFVTSGGIAPSGVPDASFTAGKFGSAALLAGDASTVFYPTTAGVPYPQAEGSLAMWFKPTWSAATPVVRSYFKPSLDKVFSATNNAGPQIVDLGVGGGMGAQNFNPDASPTNAILPVATWRSGWNELGWNHIVASWRRSPSLLSFTLNGGGSDGGVTRAETVSSWEPQVPTAGFFRFASDGNPIDGSLDDIAVWNRVLPPEEVRAMYASSVSIGDACKR